MCGTNKQFLDELNERDEREKKEKEAALTEHLDEKKIAEMPAVPTEAWDDDLEPAFSGL